MKFCSKCKGLMHTISNEQGKLKCMAFGNIEEGKIESSHKMHKKAEKGEGFVNHNDIFADYDFVCKKCGYNKAQAIIKEPMLSDEDHMIFMKCGKCGAAEQLARKVT
jgi:DNA-directed RNA polymerase subunit M/transcription elongation factor TFIIS